MYYYEAISHVLLEYVLLHVLKAIFLQYILVDMVYSKRGEVSEGEGSFVSAMVMVLDSIFRRNKR
jgi:hypothetical protein